MFVIPMRRALVQQDAGELEKSFSRVGGGHKYRKREPYFVHGKLKWRYFYDTDEQREKNRYRVDPDDSHDHHLMGELHKLHPELKSGIPSVEESTPKALQKFFTKKGSVVTAEKDFVAKWLVPYEQAAKRGEDVGRKSPMVRINHALLLLPESQHKVLDEVRGLRMTGASNNPSLENAAAYASADGEIVLLDHHTFDEPVGSPGFKGPFTSLESTLWHEIGHHAQWALDKVQRKAWLDLRGMLASREPPISNYAGSNEAEDFAETYSCAIGYPQQLAMRCPRRYEWMRANVIPELPPLEEILETPSEKLAWWSGDATTTGGKVLRQLKLTEPAPRFHTYYSDKDQFYTLSRNGRTIYMRYGPPNKEVEEQWKPIGDIIDPETGLPRYDVEAGMYFRAQEYMKEIYDEHGNPLTNKQAFFYLTQGNEKDEENFRKIGLEGSEDDYEGWVARKKKEAAERGSSWNDTQTLSFRIYSNMGRTDSTLEKERKRVEKERAKGGTGYMERHDWAPMEISPQEFERYSGTFKFAHMKEAPQERQVWRAWTLDENGKRTPLTALDTDTNTLKAALRATVYEQQNPDGSWGRIEVNESSPFLPGQTIEVPAKGGGWQKWKIPERFDATPQALAREHGTTARALMERNGRFPRGQIMNPILAALLNPTNKPIRSAGDLQEMLRKAAESDEPPRTWVSVRTGDDVESAVANIQVEFDGAGPPKVLGNYWKKVTGIQDLRIDQLIEDHRDKDGNLVSKKNLFKVKLPPIKEKKPTKNPLAPGNNVWLIDPKSGKRVMGRYVSRTESGIQVQPYPGYGAGVSKKIVTVAKVAPTMSDEIPGQPSIRTRDVEPLKDQLLLYADGVEAGSGPYSPSGYIRVKLPADRSITWRDLDGMPGVQFEQEEIPGVKTTTGDPVMVTRGATISLNDFPDFREAYGGFVADSRVQAMVQQRMNAQRMLQSTTKTFLNDEDFEAPDGNINPEGVLKGLTVGAHGIQPGAHRISALKKLAANGGRMLAAHFMGCVSGDTVIPVNRAGKGFSLPIRELFAKFNGLEGSWDEKIPTLATSVYDEHLRLNEILNVVDSGVKETFALRTQGGREIRATLEHPFWTPKGWVSLADLKPGDRIGVQGRPKRVGRAPRSYRYPYRTSLFKHPFAGVRGAKASPFRVPTHRLVVEAYRNGMELEAFVQACRDGDVSGLRFIDPRTHAVHHIDGDTLNNEIENLEVLTHGEHWVKHGEQEGWTNFPQLQVGWDVVEFVGDEREEQTFDICMHISSQSYVGNGFIIHNTGKTNLGIMAGQMMRNLTDPKDKDRAHPNRLEKRVLTLVPPNTIQNWYQEYKQFGGTPPTLLGTTEVAGAQQMFQLDKVTRKLNESDDDYLARAVEAWKEATKTNPALWNPWEDTNQNVVVGFEYFRNHEALLRATGLFDGLIVDEAHKIFRDNEVSRSVERWSPSMKLFLMLTGTPVTNTLDILPRVVELISNNKVSLGSKDEFKSRYMVPSATAMALGAKNPPITDLNPKTAAELAAKLQPLIHVATVADVKGKTMPVVLLDENEPAHMIGQQARLYNAAMAQLSDAEREVLAQSGALGVDEDAYLNEEARRKVAVARSIANSPGYKAADDREFMTYPAPVVSESGKGQKAKGKSHSRTQAKVTVQNVPFELPDYSRMTKKFPEGWGGKWPSIDWVEKGAMSEGEWSVWSANMFSLIGKNMEELSGTPIDPEILKSLKKSGEWLSPTGVKWPGKVRNPDYGPEGVTMRGATDERTDEVLPVTTRFFNSVTGHEEEVTVSPGERFIRDPNRKASGLFFASDDWDHTGRFDMSSEDTKIAEEGEEVGGKGLGEDEEGAEEEPKAKKGWQKPKDGRDAFNINRHPARRKERAAYDVALTVNNAKCDKLEATMRNILSPVTGEGPGAQMILFGNRIASSVRTMESKLRTMGYMDVNEALGHEDWSTDHDKKRALTKRRFFVTYMGKSATLGDRDINSEIFRRQQDDLGMDMGVSMFVWRSMFGTSKARMPKENELVEGWSRAERKRIAQNFQAPNAVPDVRTGKMPGLEVPLRVTSRKVEGVLKPHYVYESELKPKDRKVFQALEVELRAATGDAVEEVTDRMRKVLEPYWTERAPLSQAQADIFNNCEVMIASDAANVGLNWPSSNMIMYDSLFSPMDEAQRIARSARMLPPAFTREMKPVLDFVDNYVKEHEKVWKGKVGDTYNSSIALIKDAIAAMPPELKAQVDNMPSRRTGAKRAYEYSGTAPDQILEGYFALRAMQKVADRRQEVDDMLRKQGALRDPTLPVTAPNNYIPPAAIVQSDVVNHIIRTELSPFEQAALLARRYMVDVKRLTVSCDVVDKKGNLRTEFPVNAERAQLMRGRAKMAPYEYSLNLLQNAEGQPTRYDVSVANVDQLSDLSMLPEQHLDRQAADEKLGKSLRFVIRRAVA